MNRRPKNNGKGVKVGCHGDELSGKGSLETPDSNKIVVKFDNSGCTRQLNLVLQSGLRSASLPEANGSLGEMQQNFRNFGPSLFAGVRKNGPEIKAILRHIGPKDSQCLSLNDIPNMMPMLLKGTEPWLSAALGLGNFVPGLLVGFLLGVFVDLPKGLNFFKSAPTEEASSSQRRASLSGRRLSSSRATRIGSTNTATEVTNGELKMVFVVRQDLKMGPGKIASQCAHAAIGTYEECVSRGQRLLLKKWEECGQPKIVVTCRSQYEMNELKAKAERANLPCFVVADAGRTQVAAGSQTVLAIGPGVKAHVDTVTRHLRLL